MEPALQRDDPGDDGKTSGNRSFSRHERARALMSLAARQDALVHDVQARALGFSPWAVRRRVQTGLWQRVLPSVSKVTGAPTTERQRVRAAALWAGGDAAVSHASAAWLWGLDGFRAPARPDVTVPRRRGPSSDLVVVHRTLALPDADRAEVGGIPVTSPARTVIDAAAHLGAEALEAAVESGFRLGLYRDSFLRWRVEQLGGTKRPGSGALLRILDARGRGAAALESPLEVRAWRLLVGSDVPRPVRQHWVRGRTRWYRLDFAWRDRKVGVECDGYEPHGGRIAFRRDRRKLAALAGLGWLMVPVTWDDVTRRPDALLADVRDALAEAS
ncbi:MAG: type IV toxin-antitoxin system AbiEi family antitoxin [Acidimicrobiia bacterium]